MTTSAGERENQRDRGRTVPERKKTLYESALPWATRERKSKHNVEADEVCCNKG